MRKKAKVDDLKSLLIKLTLEGGHFFSEGSLRQNDGSFWREVILSHYVYRVIPGPWSKLELDLELDLELIHVLFTSILGTRTQTSCTYLKFL